MTHCGRYVPKNNGWALAIVSQHVYLYIYTYKDIDIGIDDIGIDNNRCVRGCRSVFRLTQTNFYLSEGRLKIYLGAGQKHILARKAICFVVILKDILMKIN